ncbi:cellulose biosynthesis protein BcsO [Serratia fonticola]|uniref:cellulose biosynthesis protein BcsO n=1 Tax=Serratia fonticola TaxID=47917 RepID=UPI0015C64ECC|nr:cellulose biosynthesis protein BcsO [Serratia fonticola]MBC3380567.1 cellulose biosynthesis protein BcsO [Serratia fonticola]NYA39766.1 cellulose biosynthesis protein BcsO [Serratia fonticola]
MSKYDDVQGFKDKTNLKDIDYKEFPRDDVASAPHRWSIVDQVAGNGGIPTSGSQPTPIAGTDLFSSASLAGEPPVQPKTVITENSALPGHIPHNFDRFAPPVEPKLTKTAQPDSPRAVLAQGNPFNSPASVPPSAPQPENPRFKQMFSKKTSSAGDVMDAGRNTLLKPLLESIASCR